MVVLYYGSSLGGMSLGSMIAHNAGWVVTSSAYPSEFCASFDVKHGN